LDICGLEIEQLPLVDKLHFQVGNTKTGGRVHSLNLLPLSTCPGASRICCEILPDGYPRCYACREACRQEKVRRRFRLNFLWTLHPQFVEWSVPLVRRAEAFRWNGSGDWYNQDYILKAHRVVRATPRVAHYCHTRSWVVPKLLPLLVELAAEPNFHMWFSFDSSMPTPPRIKGIDWCYLAVDDADQPPCEVLIFRDWPRYKPKTERPPDPFGSKVCSYEDGIEREKKTTCSRCKWCWSRAKVNH
jgi:hypothetical protein